MLKSQPLEPQKINICRDMTFTQEIKLKQLPQSWPKSIMNFEEEGINTDIMEGQKDTGRESQREKPLKQPLMMS